MYSRAKYSLFGCYNNMRDGVLIPHTQYLKHSPENV